MKLTTARNRRQAAFTLAEVMVALLFLAIVIPVAVKAISTASLAGEVAARKGTAARITDLILNESLVMTNWSNGTQSGTETQSGHEFRWTLTSQVWPADSAMQTVTADVTFSAQGKDYDVKLNTLASQPGQTTLNVTQ
jgi:Tfp pilus assembly protein PilV